MHSCGSLFRLQHTATHCNTLHHTAPLCTTLHTATYALLRQPVSALSLHQRSTRFFDDTCFVWWRQWDTATHTATHSTTHSTIHQRPTRFREHMHPPVHVKSCVYTSAHTNNLKYRRDLPFSWNSWGTGKHYHTLQQTRVQCNTQIHPEKKKSNTAGSAHQNALYIISPFIHFVNGTRDFFRNRLFV